MRQDGAITFRADKHDTKFSLRILLLIIVSICLLIPTMSFGAPAKKDAVKSINSNFPIVGISMTPSGSGIWSVARDGGIFTSGDAQFYGSTGGQRLNKPIVGMAPTVSGHGYWLVASDGGIFSFGDAQFYGSTGGIKLLQPVVGISRTTGGNGYTLAAADGGIFTFGDAEFYGSLGGGCQGSPTIGIDRSKNSAGYYTMTADGQLGYFVPWGRSSCPPPPANGCIGNTVSKRVIVSIDEQHLWLCEGERIYAESDVTTGAENNGHGTPVGNFAVYSKQRNTYLTGPGYRAHVNYWMPFIRGYGLHDASWRSVFGAGTYASVGSHGCVNMPVSFTPTVYAWVNVGTQVTVKR